MIKYAPHDITKLWILHHPQIPLMHSSSCLPDKQQDRLFPNRLRQDIVLPGNGYLRFQTLLAIAITFLALLQFKKVTADKIRCLLYSIYLSYNGILCLHQNRQTALSEMKY